MNNDFREQIRQSLLESYKPKIAEDIACAICGKNGLPLSFHMVERSYYNTNIFHKGFVPMSACGERVSGVFPICTDCAPVCKKCGLPKYNDKIAKLATECKAHAGCGICDHIQWRFLFKALVKKILKQGGR